MRILRNCTCRGTPGAFGPCTAPRTSHSPSSLRACHSRVHGYMGQCGFSQVARGLTCCIVCPSVYVLQVRRVSGTMTLFWRSAHFGFMSCRAHQTACSCSPNVAIGVTIKELEECVCEQVVATALGVNIRGYQNTTVARTRLNPCIFVEVLHVQCCWRALFSDRARLDAQSALIS